MPELYPVFEVPTEMVEDMTPQTEIPTPLKTPFFDFQSGQTKITARGRPVEAVDHEAYKQWVTKCVLTERYEYLAYSPDFGTEIKAIMRANYPRSITESEIRRTITEALSVDPRTVSVGGFAFEWQGDSVRVTCEVESVYGRDEFAFTFGGVG